MDEHDVDEVHDPQLERSITALGGPPPPPLDLPALRARADRRRIQRRAGILGVAAAAIVVALAAGPTLVSGLTDEESRAVVVSPDTPDTTPVTTDLTERAREDAERRARQARDREIAERQARETLNEQCVAARVGTAEIGRQDHADARRTVELLIAARMAGSGADRCATPDGLMYLDHDGTDLLLNMRPPEHFDSPYTPDEDAARATRAIPSCRYFADCADPVVAFEIVSMETLDNWPQVASFVVRSTTASGRSYGESYTVAWVRTSEPTDVGVFQLLVDGVSMGGFETLAVDAERVVVDYMAALAAGRYDQAAVWFNSDGGMGTLDESPSHEVRRLVGAEPDLVAASDYEGLLEAYCTRLDGACRPVLDVVQVETEPMRVILTLDDGAGSPYVADGATQFALTVGWFEGWTSVPSLPSPVPRR